MSSKLEVENMDRVVGCQANANSVVKETTTTEFLHTIASMIF
jgi:hypothetical protein